MLFDVKHYKVPNRYPWTKDFIKAMWQGFWTADKFSFTSDVYDFKHVLTKKERKVIIRTLAAIAQIELAVKRFWSNLGNNLPDPNIESLGIVMAHVEEIHSDAYEKLLHTLGLSHEINGILRNQIMRDRLWALNHMAETDYSDYKKGFLISLINFTIFIENVSLFSQFYIILWFNRYKGVLKDTAQQIKYTRNEETLHAQVGFKLIRTLRNEYPNLLDEEDIEIIKRAADLAFVTECKMIKFILSDYKNDNLNTRLLQEFVRNRIKMSLDELDINWCKKTIDTEPFKWMDEGVYATAKVDFLNSEPVAYTQFDLSHEDDF